MPFPEPRVLPSVVRGLRGLVLLIVVAWAALPAAVTTESNLDYAGTGNPRQQLDLYLPAARPPGGLLPVVVFIHGGGWQNGSKAAGKGWLQPWVESGHYAGASIGYRLAGEARWPAPIHDAKAAIRWLRANAARWGLDPQRIAVAGVSAGGTVALLLGLAVDVQELEGEVGAHRDVSSRVQAVVNLYGRVDFLAEPAGARAAPSQAAGLEVRLRQLFGEAPDAVPAVARLASPLTHARRGGAPILTLHGTADALVPWVQAERLDAALRAAGGEHLLVRCEGFGHGFQGPAAAARARQFLDRHLRGLDVAVSAAPIVAPEKKAAVAP